MKVFPFLFILPDDDVAADAAAAIFLPSSR